MWCGDGFLGHSWARIRAKIEGGRVVYICERCGLKKSLEDRGNL